MPSLFLLWIPRSPRSTLFPYTTLFRSLPGHDKWTFGGARGIFAESPNRVYLLSGGELPNIPRPAGDRKSTRLNSSHANISYAVFCLKKKRRDDALAPDRHHLRPGVDL